MPERSSHMKQVAISALLAISLISACASGTGPGSNQPPAVTNARVMWEDGLKAIETGEAMITRGEQRLALGRQQIRDGEAKIRDGNERAARAKSEYAQLATAIDSLPAAERKARSEVLRETGSRWQAAIDDVKAGNRIVATGNTNISRGETEIREGQKLMETGSVLMRNSSRSRQGQELLPLPSGT